MGKFKISINIPVLKDDEFNQVYIRYFVSEYTNKCLQLKDRKYGVFDSLGDEYVLYKFETDDIVDIYLLGRYVALYLS